MQIPGTFSLAFYKSKRLYPAEVPNSAPSIRLHLGFDSAIISYYQPSSSSSITFLYIWDHRLSIHKPCHNYNTYSTNLQCNSYFLLKIHIIISIHYYHRYHYYYTFNTSFRLSILRVFHSK